MANSVDSDQAAPIGAVCSGSTLFASILKLVSNVRQLFAADDFSRQHFQMHFFLGALRVKHCNETHQQINLSIYNNSSDIQNAIKRTQTDMIHILVS